MAIEMMLSGEDDPIESNRLQAQELDDDEEAPRSPPNKVRHPVITIPSAPGLPTYPQQEEDPDDENDEEERMESPPQDHMFES